MRVCFSFIVVVGLICFSGCRSTSAGRSVASDPVESRDAETAALLQRQSIPEVNFRDAGSLDVAGFVADHANGAGFSRDITQEIATNAVIYKIRLHSDTEAEGVNAYVQPIVQKMLPLGPVYSLQARDVSTFTLLEEVSNLFGWKVEINHMEIILTTPNIKGLTDQPIKGGAVVYHEQF